MAFAQLPYTYCTEFCGESLTIALEDEFRLEAFNKGTDAAALEIVPARQRSVSRPMERDISFGILRAGAQDKRTEWNILYETWVANIATAVLKSLIITGFEPNR